jgi:hypothetical protein
MRELGVQIGNSGSILWLLTRNAAKEHRYNESGGRSSWVAQTGEDDAGFRGAIKVVPGVDKTAA